MAAKRLRTGCARRWCATSLYGWDPVTNPAPAGPWRDQKAAAWPRFDPAATWLAGLDLCQCKIINYQLLDVSIVLAVQRIGGEPHLSQATSNQRLLAPRTE